MYFIDELNGPSFDLVYAAILVKQISQKKQIRRLYFLPFTVARCLSRVPDNELWLKALLWMSSKSAQPAWFDCIALIETHL